MRKSDIYIKILKHFFCKCSRQMICHAYAKGLCCVLLCILVFVSGLCCPVVTGTAKTGADIRRQYARTRQSADSNENTVKALTLEIKHINRKMIKEVGHMEELQKEI
ncbi:MAG: hypothetical protein IJ733_21060 [Lachnospiraceae bacterium]|nr:hypothetical protein [Lachnospiraceae bacterium]